MLPKSNGFAFESGSRRKVLRRNGRDASPLSPATYSRPCCDISIPIPVGILSAQCYPNDKTVHPRFQQRCESDLAYSSCVPRLPASGDEGNHRHERVTAPSDCVPVGTPVNRAIHLAYCSEMA